MLTCASLSGLVAGCATKQAVELLAAGDERELRPRSPVQPERARGNADVVVIALDGLDRALLYELLQGGKLPKLGRLLFSDHGAFPHAYFEDNMLSTLPSTTLAAWATAFTGEPPAAHGITGNEFFVREEARFVAPIPVSFSDSKPLIESFTEDYADKACLVPSVFERMRQRDPNVQIWITMQPFHRGADKLLLTDRGALLDAFKAYLARTVTAVATDHSSKDVYETLDEEVMESLLEALRDRKNALPNVLIAYLGGPDLFAHVAKEGPDEARIAYMRDALEPGFEKLYDTLNARGSLRDPYVVVVADHGHTEVVDDDAHALDKEPAAVLAKAGFRVRPFQLEVDDDDSQAVLAYQGAMAYVYLADRSGCAKRSLRCDWKKPPRFQEDVLAAADAFYRATTLGEAVPSMKGTLGLVLARHAKPYRDVDEPFQVYVGGGRLVSIAEYFAKHPHPSYVAVAERFAELAAGPAGERAGDVLLLAHNGDRQRPEHRYYFAPPYHSFHGSPSRRDSELPLIVAHPQRGTDELRGLVRRAIGDESRQKDFAKLLLHLRYGSAQ